MFLIFLYRTHFNYQNILSANYKRKENLKEDFNNKTGDFANN